MALPGKVSNQLAPPPIVGFVETRNPVVDTLRVGFGLVRGGFDLAGKAINLGIKRYQELNKLDVAGLSSNPISGFDLDNVENTDPPPFLGGQVPGVLYRFKVRYGVYSIANQTTFNKLSSEKLEIGPIIAILETQYPGIVELRVAHGSPSGQTSYESIDTVNPLIDRFVNQRFEYIIRNDGTSQEADINQGGNPPPGDGQPKSGKTATSRFPVSIGILEPSIKDAITNFLEPEPFLEPTIKAPPKPAAPTVIPPPSQDPTEIEEPTKVPFPKPIIFPVPVPILIPPVPIAPIVPPGIPTEPKKPPVIPIVPVRPPLLPEAPSNPVTEPEKKPIKPIPIVKAPPITVPINPNEPVIIEPEKPKAPFIPTLPSTDCEELLECLGSRLPEKPDIPEEPEPVIYRFVLVTILQNPMERQTMNVSTHGLGEDVKMAGYIRFVIDGRSVGPEAPIRRDSQLFFMPEWADGYDLQAQNGALLHGQILEFDKTPTPT